MNKFIITGCALFVVLLAFLWLRPDSGPTAANIEEGYRNLRDKNLANAVAKFGSEESVPPLILGMINMTARIDNPHCEQNPNDLGYICLYNLTLINAGNVALDELPDIKARVFEVDAGWMVHEVPGENVSGLLNQPATN